MASTVDERVVNMDFNGSTFIDGIKKAIQAITQLKSGLGSLKGSADDINNLDAAGKKFSLSGIASGVSTISSKFSAMSIVGISALATIASKAVSVGLDLVKSLTITPIAAGLQNYETKINAIQTILANTSASGTTLAQVTSALANLNVYANKTVYNFSQMAQNIGTFTAAGVGLNTAVSSIKGIANLAALSGSSAEQATGAMYQLSQAIAAGRVKLQDWNSVVNAGIGGKAFQTALINTARAEGVSIDAMIKKQGGFRNSLQSGWLSAKILTDTLNQFTGDLSASQLKAMGFTEAQTVAILKQGKIAVQSATQVRTFTQLQQDLTEEVGTAYATIFGTLIGNITQATSLLSGAHTVLENAFTKPIYDLNNLLVKWVALGGRADVIKSISNVFTAFSLVLHTVGAAFAEVFPPATALTLLKLAFALEKFTSDLILSKNGVNDLKTIFVGLFSIIKIVVDIIGDVVDGLKQTGSAASKTGGNFIDLVAKIAQWITNIRKALESGSALKTFFVDLGKVLAIPIQAIGGIIGALGGFTGVINKLVDEVSPFVKKVGNEFSKLASAIGQGISSGNFSNVINILDELLYGGVLLSIRKFITGLGKGDAAEKTGLLDTIKESFEGLTSTLKTMQTTLKSKTLESIAIAVALLTASLVALSFLNIKQLTTSLTAITVMFTQLLGAMAIVSKISGTAGIVKMGAVAIALNILATAIVILSGAVVILAHLSWSQIERGLSAITGLLIVLVAATTLMGANAKGTVAAAYSMEIMAIAMNILASAVGKLGKLNTSTLVKGISAIAALILIMTSFSKFGGGEGLIATATSMLILGAALTVIAQVIQTLGKMSIDSLAKGLVAIAAALVIIGVAMRLMPANMLLTAASLFIVAKALVVLSQALVTLGAMSWSAVAKSLIELAGALAIIAIAMIAMTEALPGAAALIVVAAALALLTPVLVAFSQLSWEGIAKSLVVLAGVFVIIAAAGFLIGPVVPILLGLGAAIVLLGVGILAVGAGVALFAAGIAALAVATAGSGAAIAVFFTTVLGLIPLAFKQLGAGLVELAGVIGAGGPAITKALAALLSAILLAIIKIVPLAVKAFEVILNGILAIVPKYAPKLVLAIARLILAMLTILDVYAPRFVGAAITLIVNLVDGIAQGVGRIIAAAARVVVAFIDGIGNAALTITRAGAEMIIHLINGLASQIRAETPQLDAAAINLGGAIIDGMTFGLASKVGGFLGKVANVGSEAISALGSAIGWGSPAKEFYPVGASIPDGMGVGFSSTSDNFIGQVSEMGDKSVQVMKDSLSTVNDLVNNNMSLHPTITPVLDLTQAKAGFGQLSTLSKSQLINATASTTTATSISAGNAAAAEAAGVNSKGSTNLTFVQNNTSPKALDATTIYRQTKNQLSVTKGALAPNANVG